MAQGNCVFLPPVFSHWKSVAQGLVRNDNAGKGEV